MLEPKPFYVIRNTRSNMVLTNPPCTFGHESHFHPHLFTDPVDAVNTFKTLLTKDMVECVLVAVTLKEIEK